MATRPVRSTDRPLRKEGPRARTERQHLLGRGYHRVRAGQVRSSLRSRGRIVGRRRGAKASAEEPLAASSAAWAPARGSSRSVPARFPARRGLRRDILPRGEMPASSGRCLRDSCSTRAPARRLAARRMLAPSGRCLRRVSRSPHHQSCPSAQRMLASSGSVPEPRRRAPSPGSSGCAADARIVGSARIGAGAGAGGAGAAADGAAAATRAVAGGAGAAADGAAAATRAVAGGAGSTGSIRLPTLGRPPPRSCPPQARRRATSHRPAEAAWSTSVRGVLFERGSTSAAASSKKLDLVEQCELFGLEVLGRVFEEIRRRRGHRHRPVAQKLLRRLLRTRCRPAGSPPLRAPRPMAGAVDFPSSPSLSASIPCPVLRVHRPRSSRDPVHSPAQASSVGPRAASRTSRPHVGISWFLLLAVFLRVACASRARAPHRARRRGPRPPASNGPPRCSTSAPGTARWRKRSRASSGPGPVAGVRGARAPRVRDPGHALRRSDAPLRGRSVRCGRALRRAPPRRRSRACLRESLRVASRVVAIKDHFRFGRLSAAVLYAMDRAGNAAASVPSPGNYFSAASFASLVDRAGGRIASIEWPLRVHDFPFWLITRDEHQFAAARPACPSAPSAPSAPMSPP